MRDDDFGAFLPGPRLRIAGAATGPLRGLSVAVKDLIDVAGHPTGFGNPDWAASHPVPERNAPVIDRLLAAGASIDGKTILDELAFSLEGRNLHYGAPSNANAPGRITGGSSSGSAAAVAAGLVDAALGSDTGGSVRVPAGLTGIYGIRPSHGRIPMAGMRPLAESFDTVGWFAREAALLARVGGVLLGPDAAGWHPRRLILPEDAWAVADPAVREALAPALGTLEARFGAAGRVAVGGLVRGDDADLTGWKDRFRILQGREIWLTHGDWIEQQKPRFGPEIAARFAFAKSISAEAAAGARPMRELFAAAIERLTADSVLAIPTAAVIAPHQDDTPEAFLAYRDRTLTLTCIAGLARVPQVTIPAGKVEGAPVGLSLIARRGADVALLALAAELASAPA
ncbi:MAG TPA: amidase [Methylomirabilota bacterium]|jgi:amidase|nr:amidase [Methylomirabilota bacterium]